MKSPVPGLVTAMPKPGGRRAEMKLGVGAAGVREKRERAQTDGGRGSGGRGGEAGVASPAKLPVPMRSGRQSSCRSWGPSGPLGSSRKRPLSPVSFRRLFQRQVLSRAQFLLPGLPAFLRGARDPGTPTRLRVRRPQGGQPRAAKNPRGPGLPLTAQLGHSSPGARPPACGPGSWITFSVALEKTGISSPPWVPPTPICMSACLQVPPHTPSPCPSAAWCPWVLPREPPPSGH